MSWIPPWIQKALGRRLGSGRIGQAQAMRELRRAREVFRFAGMFAVTILLPAMLLSYFALSTLQHEEHSVDADLRSRADGLTALLRQELEKKKLDFAAVLEERLQRRESVLANLGDLSPYLRGAYRVDLAGDLAAPFDLEPPAKLAAPPTRYRDLVAEARRLDGAASHAEAAEVWVRAASMARQPAYEAEAELGQARSLFAGGDPEAADALLEEIATSYADLRESHGFRIHDIAVHQRAEMRFAQDPQAGAAALENLLDRLLDRTWTVGYGGEAAVAARALSRLTSIGYKPDKVAQARARLNERADQLKWAENIRDELGQFVNIPNLPLENHDLQYYGARPESPAIWATLSDEQGLFVFSFDFWMLYNDLAATVQSMNLLEEDLVAELIGPEQPTPEGTLVSGSLQRPMQLVRITISPSDPQRLALRKKSRRSARVVVVLVAIFMVLVGVVFSARIISREVENARVKADFAANVSHELRSPITQIRLKGEALQLGLVDPGEDMQNHFDAIVREAERLSRLVDNVLDFAAIERGAKRYHLRPDDLLAVVWNTAETMRNAIESRGIALDVDVPDDLPPIWLDREATSQVLINLMSNAAKYGADGGWIGVKVRLGLNSVDVSVSDRGIGIDHAELEHIFEHFYRSTNPNVRKRKGTGIGLTIVRYIVEAHGGTIAVDSAPNRGSTFTITYPLEPPEGHGAHA